VDLDRLTLKSQEALATAQRTQERLLQRGTLAVTDDAKRHLTDAGYDPTFGARPLRRLISKELSDGIALALLQGEYREGDAVRVDAPDGELVFERIPAKEKK
jgi:ATP-dependent Clp protease ATP-binding subunit ClpB